MSESKIKDTIEKIIVDGKEIKSFISIDGNFRWFMVNKLWVCSPYNVKEFKVIKK